MIIKKRGSDRAGLAFERGAAIGNLGSSKGSGHSLQVLGGTWGELAKKMPGGNDGWGVLGDDTFNLNPG